MRCWRHTRARSAAIAPRELADRAPRLLGSAHEREHLLHTLVAGAAQRKPPARAVQAQPDEVDAADACARVEQSTLWQIPDLALARARLASEHQRPAGRQRQLAE
jgi:predicted ABC-type transport system involved in lysophospholipase L1 biosynthesis ATPase subunit